jgi:hypothetical protein
MAKKKLRLPVCLVMLKVSLKISDKLCFCKNFTLQISPQEVHHQLGCSENVTAKKD